MNLDKTNLRKQTSLHLLWGQATLVVDKKGSTKIDFINSPEDQRMDKKPGAPAPEP